MLRASCVSVLAIFAAAAAMALAGSPHAKALAWSAMGLISGALVLQVYWAVRQSCRASQRQQQAACDAEEHYAQVLYRIMNFVEARDQYWGGHSERVAKLAEHLARRMGLDESMCHKLHMAGRLHDIGMIAMPEELIKRNDLLGVDEYRRLMPHSQVSYDVLKPMSMLADVLPAIKGHHERMNGTGYPDGLAGEAIAMPARVLAVADAYDAMTHDRPHRLAMTAGGAIAELRRCSPAGYDRTVVDALADIINVTMLEDRCPQAAPAAQE
ncbi:MAG: HD domain-containing protein [Planctomycetaceae bacterium]|nr:HD domain-containing protein [Planctomycetaceae bacterium]